MIIVEGPDGSGKTTLAWKLSVRMGLEIAPRVVTKDAEAMVDLRVWVQENVRAGFQYKIFDRHRLISEFIYGPILRDTQEDGFNDIDWVSEQMFRFYATRPVIIYCLPPLATVQKNLKNDPDNKVVEGRVEALYTAYIHRIALDMMHYPARTHVFDYTRDSVTDILRALKPYAAPAPLERMHGGNHGHR